MPLSNYGVLKGRVLNRRRGIGRSRHYQIHVHDGGTDHRVAINFRSKTPPSELQFLVDEDFVHPVTSILSDLPFGYTELSRGPETGALDYIRGNLFSPDRMRGQPYQTPATVNDLKDKIDIHVQRARAHEGAIAYVFGEPWGPENHVDKHFRFNPGRGMHEVHMNQGNTGSFKNNDGVWQDGALLIQFPEDRSDRWIAIFLAFQSQAWHTDDRTGHALEEIEVGLPSAHAGSGAGFVRIVAALVNPAGDDSGETVTLLNTTPHSLNLNGWSLLDNHKRRTVIKDLVILPGRTEQIDLHTGEARLGNKGGIISLLTPQGGKVDGASYTREQALNQGWTVVF